jgi:hypothetical protein
VIGAFASCLLIGGVAFAAPSALAARSSSTTDAKLVSSLDVSVTATVTKSAGKPCGTLPECVYTLTVTNAGTTNVTGFTYTPVSGFKLEQGEYGTVKGNTISSGGGAIANGSSASILLSVASGSPGAPGSSAGTIVAYIQGGGSLTVNVTALIPGPATSGPATATTTTTPATTTTLTTTTPKPTTTKTTTTTTTTTTAIPTAKKAALVMGFLDPTLYFESGVFSRRVSVTQHVLVKNRGPDASPGGTFEFHFPDGSYGLDAPAGDAVSECELRTEHDENASWFNISTYYDARCNLGPIGVGETHEIVVSYKVLWGKLTATAAAYVNGTDDVSNHTAAQSLEIDKVNPFKASFVMKLGADYKVEGSKTSDNPALK